MDAVPPHCVDAVAEVAQQCAESWQKFTRELARRKLSDRARIAGRPTEQELKLTHDRETR